MYRGLIPKCDSPFKVVKKVCNVAYKLKLPERLQIHLTFHVSFLKPYHEDSNDLARNETRCAPSIVMV